MLMVISPAKTLDFDTPAPIDTHTRPEFINDAKWLMEQLRPLAPQDVAKLMKLSDKLGTLNYDRFQQWQPRHSTKGKAAAHNKQALLAFRGDVYTGLDADSFSEGDFEFAQDHLRILSGLYGLLRPLDLIQPYRLEMGTRLANPRGENLYDFWGDKLTQWLNREFESDSKSVLLNLASNEYFKALQPKKLQARIISPIFKDKQKGQYKIVSFYAKKARGMMAAYVIKKRIDDPAKLRYFKTGGYRYNANLSSPDEPVFTRDQS